jgi:hypothetical protein
MTCFRSPTPADNEVKANGIQLTKENIEKLINAICHPGIGNCHIFGG